MAIALGVIFPYTVIITAKALRYMQGFSARLFTQLFVLWLLLLSFPFFFEVINSYIGPWNHDLVLNYIGMSTALFTISFAVYCYHNRHVLQTLLPKQEFILEQEKRQRLLAKLQACDNKMPMARFESRNGVVISANPFAQEQLGYTLAQFHKLEPGALVHPDDRAVVLKNMIEHSGVPYECRIVTATGRFMNVEVRTTHDPSDPTLHITFLTDITNYVQERDRRIRDLRSQHSLQYRQQQDEALSRVLTNEAVML